MSRQEGEPLMHLNRIAALPSDARAVLHIRSEVQKELRQGGGAGTPVDDLMIEDNRPDLKAEGIKVVHPITFILPTIVLRVLSQLNPLQKVDLP
ncbi:MAG: hypothetical protein Q8P10_02420 [bacterium]|nr:hypothetical protein [bacterium]